ncbi:MAG: RidA family protein [Cyanobacteria bacterium P01_D01_bin.14]
MESSRRHRYFTGTQWEPKVGYCRAVRAGQLIFLSGSAPVAENGSTYAPGDAYAQARRCFEIIQSTLQAMDADLSDVVRTRMFVTDISQWEAFGRAHQEFMGEFPPVTSMVEVRRLIAPDMLIEIEADAVVDR